MHPLKLYNTFTKRNEVFEPIKHPFVGIYLCGPTVYGEPHLGHSRGPVTFDVLHRYLLHLQYKVRFVRNITDVGHLVDDADEGEDKIAKRAKIEQLEPMEVAQLYTNSYNSMLYHLNTLPASIEPRASGHILEQIEMIETIVNNGFAYESNGSVYFDVDSYSKKHPYGTLSGRVPDELLAGSSVRDLQGQEEKRNAADFALWKKATPEHIMKWNSPWSIGFPGWHIECSAMSNKYLGQQFDIHGGGMDLLFPHHESEIAQSTACFGINPARYWIHHNMVTINGQKMAKSLNNGVLIHELFSGKHPLLEQAYSPMTLRFFILQAHYRGTLDFSNEALKAAEKGLARLMNAAILLDKLQSSDVSTWKVVEWKTACYSAMNEDLNTPILIASLFEAVKVINSVHSGLESLNQDDLAELRKYFTIFVYDILGLKQETSTGDNKVEGLMQVLIGLRNKAKAEKNYELSDSIRIQLQELGFVIKDSKEGTTYSIQ